MATLFLSLCEAREEVSPDWAACAVWPGQAGQASQRGGGVNDWDWRERLAEAELRDTVLILFIMPTHWPGTRGQTQLVATLQSRQNWPHQAEK